MDLKSVCSILKRRMTLFSPLGKSKTFYDQVIEAIEAKSKVKHPKPERYQSRYKPNSQATAATDNTETTLKQRKFCVLLGYSGGNYYGMQRNATLKIIEDELLVAMLKHKWITNADKISSCN